MKLSSAKIEKSKDICEVEKINEEAIKRAMEKIADEGLLLRISENFKVLSDATRLKILQALSSGELCVCELAHLLALSVSAVSHQLRILRSYNLVKFRKHGKMVYYSLADEHVIEIIENISKHVSER